MTQFTVHQSYTETSSGALTLKHSGVKQPEEEEQDHEDHVGSREVHSLRGHRHGGWWSLAH